MPCGGGGGAVTPALKRSSSIVVKPPLGAESGHAAAMIFQDDHDGSDPEDEHNANA